MVIAVMIKYRGWDGRDTVVHCQTLSKFKVGLVRNCRIIQHLKVSPPAGQSPKSRIIDEGIKFVALLLIKSGELQVDVFILHEKLTLLEF